MRYRNLALYTGTVSRVSVAGQTRKGLMKFRHTATGDQTIFVVEEFRVLGYYAVWLL
jgi:hypothetical protein